MWTTKRRYKNIKNLVMIFVANAVKNVLKFDEFAESRAGSKLRRTRHRN